MSQVVSGDKVEYKDKTYIVVDVSPGEPDLAVIRTEDDLDLQYPDAVPVEELKVVGHLEQGEVEGWTEAKPGQWKRDEEPPADFEEKVTE